MPATQRFGRSTISGDSLPRIWFLGRLVPVGAKISSVGAGLEACPPEHLPVPESDPEPLLRLSSAHESLSIPPPYTAGPVSRHLVGRSSPDPRAGSASSPELSPRTAIPYP